MAKKRRSKARRTKASTQRWRVIVRYSISKDTKRTKALELTGLHNAVGKRLKTDGMRNKSSRTSTFENQTMKPNKAQNCISSVLDTLDKRKRRNGKPFKAHLDHLWLYIDKA